MYAYIKGELAETNPDHIVIETGGIGYQVFISGQTFEYLPAVGEEIKVYTYLYLREDAILLVLTGLPGLILFAMILYGFLTKDDLELFKLLISVSGIGPKGGLAILSALSADDLRFAVLSGDSKAISKAPGVGAKTAQRVILELKDKMSLEDAFEKKSEHVQTLKISGNGQVRNDAVMALTALGYSSAESLKAVSAVEITEEMDVEAVLKAALKHMSLL